MSYPPRSFGRVVECLKVYTHPNPYDLAHTCQIGDGKVTFHGDLVATFTWPDDNPLFDFVETRYREQQYRKRRYLDDSAARFNFDCAVQEVRECLTFDEALAIRHVRDRLDGEWNDITIKGSTLDKIRRTLYIATHKALPKSIEDVHHVAMCAIYDVPAGPGRYKPGFYKFRTYGGAKDQVVQVTETHIRFAPDRLPMRLDQLGSGCTLTPLDPRDILRDIPVLRDSRRPGAAADDGV
jgi:hypothetical protein